MNVPQLQGRHQHDATLTATVGAGTYTYEKSGVTFANSQYYAIAVKMTKQYAMTTTVCSNKNISTPVSGAIWKIESTTMWYKMFVPALFFNLFTHLSIYLSLAMRTRPLQVMVIPVIPV